MTCDECKINGLINVQDQRKCESSASEGQVKECRMEGHVMRTVVTMNENGYMGRGRLEKQWMDCVKHDMKGMNAKLTSDRGE